MMFQKALFLLVLAYADAFTVSRTTSRVAFSSQLTNHRAPVANSFTRLCAEESENGEAEPDVQEEVPSEEASEAEEEAIDESSEEEASPSTSTDDILNSPAFLNRKIDVLKSDIEAVNAKIDAANALYEENKAEWGPQIETLRKEYANISNRLDNQGKAGNAVAIREVADTLLSVLDNCDRAFKAVEPQSGEEKEIEASYVNVNNMIINTLAELGVKRVETVGTEFDYEFHQAVMMRPDEDYEEGIVCEELQKGWAMEDGPLIRPAMVVVAQ